jgi:acetyl esterase/lipase
VYGDKGDNAKQMKAIASRGYVAASINYRLVPILETGVLATRQPPKIGAEDFRAAVRFMRKQASTWNLDTSRIVLSGNSAGAMNALYVAFAKKEQSEGNGGNPGYSSAVNAVVSVSGGLVDRALCNEVDPYTFEPSGCIINGEDDTDEMSSGDIPVVFLHGTSDTTIPYKNCLEAAQRANSTGVRNLLLSIPGAGHVPMDDCLSSSEPYLHQWTSFLAASLNTAEAECPPRNEFLL